MKLKITWIEFTDKIDSFLASADGILKRSKSIETKNQFNELKKTIIEWKSECEEFLEASFEIDTETEYNKFAIDFRNDEIFGFEYVPDETTDSLPSLLRDRKDYLADKCEKLKYFKTILKICDAIIKPQIDIHVRSQYSTEEVLDLILKKLYDLYDSNYYPVSIILEGNGIFIKRREEGRELIEILEKKGHVNSKGYDLDDLTAQLTAKGKIYVEKLRKKHSVDYDPIKKSKKELDGKIDEIKNELWKLGLGQEVIYNEFEELKSLYLKIDKKTWGQVLKGKLIDLGLSQLLPNEMIGHIYKELTDEVLKLK